MAEVSHKVHLLCDCIHMKYPQELDRQGRKVDLWFVKHWDWKKMGWLLIGMGLILKLMNCENIFQTPTELYI
jgi:hypothetical protein